MLSRLFISRKIFVCLLAMGATTLLGACGGGGGGELVFPKISYTGVQTEAVIDQTNADEFPVAMLEGSGSSGVLTDNVVTGASIEPEFAEGIPDADNIQKASGVVSGLVKNSLANNANQVTGVTQSENGPCGGTATVSANDTGSSISGSVTFNNFCGYEGITVVTLHGRMTIYAEYSGDYEFTRFDMTIEYLKMTVTEGGTTVSDVFAGSISATIDPVTQEATFTMSVNFVHNGVVFKVANFGVDEVTGNIYGTLYHPAYGYVEITTTTPFTYDPFNDQFCGGTLQVVGSDGAVPPATGTVTVEFIADASCLTYDICVTVNADLPNCVFDVPWGDPAWPAPAVPALPAT